jgi:hypothetical protein
MSMDDQVLDPAPGSRRPWNLLTRVMVVVAALALGAFGLLIAVRDDDDGDVAPTVVPIPASYYNLIVAAAESCPMLTTARLAAQLMANSGFDPLASVDGREGIAGLTDQAWQRWLPWPNADRTDPNANITALAHQMCDFAGQLRLARTPGEPWHLALAAHRTTLDDVLLSRGVPAIATAYVHQVNEYAQAYQATEGSSGSVAAPPGMTMTAPSAVGSTTATPAPSATPEPTAGQSPTGEPTSTGPAPSTTTTDPPTAPSQPVTGPTGMISGYLGKCIHVANTNSADDTQIDLYPCNGGPAEMMTMASDGTIRVLGKCIDIKDQSTSNGARIVLFTCNGSPSQQWSFTTGRDIVNPRADKCIDVLDALTYDGVPLQLWECNGGAHQKWWVPGA